MQKDSSIYVAGGQTLIGAAILRQLHRQGYINIVGGADEEPDLTDGPCVADFFKRQVPEYVFFAAGKSGGIQANQTYPADLMYDNLLASTHVIHNAWEYGVKKFLYLASSCSYPRHCPQPMQVDALLSGSLEPTNEAYAVAKIAGIKLSQAYRQQYQANFIVGIPANAFGPGDDFDLENAHVIAALMRRMHEAKHMGLSCVEVWGTGTPRREFIFADDLADACLFVMNHYDDIEPINLGGGTDVSIAELASMIQKIVGYEGVLHFNTSRPDGMPLKALDSSRLLTLGWCPSVSFEEALMITYNAFLQTQPGMVNVSKTL